MLLVKLFSFVLAWTVTWLGFYDETLKTLTGVETGDNVSAQAPIPPKVDCYRFTNWDRSADYVASDLVIHAVYEMYRYVLSIEAEPEMLHGTIVAQEPFAFDANNQITDLPCGTTVLVRAVPEDGFALSRWFLNGVELNTTSSTLDILLDETTVLDGNIAIRATFDQSTAIEPVIGNPSTVTIPYKIIENQQVVIIRNNEKYDVTGKKLE